MKQIVSALSHNIKMRILKKVHFKWCYYFVIVYIFLKALSLLEILSALIPKIFLKTLTIILPIFIEIYWILGLYKYSILIKNGVLRKFTLVTIMATTTIYAVSIFNLDMMFRILLPSNMLLFYVIFLSIKNPEFSEVIKLRNYFLYLFIVIIAFLSKDFLWRLLLAVDLPRGILMLLPIASCSIAVLIFYNLMCLYSKLGIKYSSNLVASDILRGEYIKVERRNKIITVVLILLVLSSFIINLCFVLFF